MAEVCAVWPGAEPARSVLALLDDLVGLVTAGTGGAAEGAVHAHRRGADWLIASTGDRLTRSGAAVDQAGPWREALGTGASLVLPDLRAEAAAAAEPWRAVALRAGFRGVLALPAPLQRGGTAALTLYLDEPGACGPEVVRRAGGFAGEMASLIELHSTIPAREPALSEAEAARRTRASVDHAVGVLMEVRGCDEDEARHVLEVLGASQGRTLDAVAASVVRHAVRPGRGGLGGGSAKAARGA
ncbi:ANTAR domain-containing protein [Cellulomonas sp. Y8]|uniref:ANTAR domain-containing protein n=1 Tax=Cellulomonas sp. Y8 TaxID=2591145 RepID=UPI0011C77D29|nr:ANTAR domain-containing protein [Cellulomonas sp. Y8]